MQTDSGLSFAMDLYAHWYQVPYNIPTCINKFAFNAVRSYM